ncbi:hypothetical protein ACHAPJ_011834 [Fusarium lateritium]
MQGLSIELTAPNGRKWTQPLGLFINNEFVAATGGGTITSIDPATERQIATVHAASIDDVDRAVQAARLAFDTTWGQVSATDRGKLLARLADLVDKNKETLATIEAWDNGKPFHMALALDINDVAGTIRYYGGWADKLAGQTIMATKDKFACTLRKPIGVCGQIIPWNYPLAMAAWKLGPALACGNTVVLKAAEQTPLSILVLASLIRESGFPPGVVNIINGEGREAGSALVRHPLVDKVAFTGSTATGKAIMSMASESLKNITLETGGKSPLVVFDDADLDQAAKWCHLGIMSNQGQICTATSRVLVHEKVHDAFLAKLLEVIKTVSKIGDQWDDTVYQGPQVTGAQQKRILSFIESGKAEGATLVTGGNPQPGVDGKGFFVQPTVFTNVKDTMTISREEIFGPVVAISVFSEESEVIKRANDSVYGLGAAVFTQDIQRAMRVAPTIESGMVWINSSQDADFKIPFGGVKQSGVGRELGEAGLEGYSTLQSIHMNIGWKL